MPALLLSGLLFDERVGAEALSALPAAGCFSRWRLARESDPLHAPPWPSALPVAPRSSRAAQL